jgi:hypothetical protein
MKPYGYWILLVSALLLSPPAWAQYNVPHQVIGGGGGGSTDGTIYLHGTIGQRVIGVVTSPSYDQKMGYYYILDQLHIGPTSEAFISQFVAELSGWGVNLEWAIGVADGLKGYYIYRSQSEEGPYQRLNTALIPVEEGTSWRDENVRPGRTYWYRLGVVDRDGEFLSAPVSVTLPPAKLTLYQNYPNPFNPSTTISFYLPEPSTVELMIFDVNGRRVRRLVSEKRTFGEHRVDWDGRSDRGEPVGSGVYFYRLRAGKKILSKKLTLLK